jgi:hypothetical protein
MKLTPLSPGALDSSSHPYIHYLGFKHPMNRQNIHDAAFLAMNLPRNPILKLRDDLAHALDRPLKGFNEAHITVVTPPELNDHFVGVAQDEISIWAQTHGIQKLPFFVRGVGQASLSRESGPSISTYFLVVESADILRFRSEVFKRFSRTKAEDLSFEPHITLGFTERDLHAQEGIRKDASSLILDWGKIPQNAPKTV